MIFEFWLAIDHTSMIIRQPHAGRGPTGQCQATRRKGRQAGSGRPAGFLVAAASTQGGPVALVLVGDDVDQILATATD